MMVTSIDDDLLFVLFIKSCDQKYIGNQLPPRKHHGLLNQSPYHCWHPYHHCCRYHGYDYNHLQPHERHDRILVEVFPVHTYMNVKRQEKKNVNE
jgi:hypothetical protein